MHGGARVRLGEHEQRPLARLGADRGGKRAKLADGPSRGASRSRCRGRCPATGRSVVVASRRGRSAVAEEREVLRRRATAAAPCLRRARRRRPAAACASSSAHDRVAARRASSASRSVAARTSPRTRSMSARTASSDRRRSSRGRPRCAPTTRAARRRRRRRRVGRRRAPSSSPSAARRTREDRVHDEMDAEVVAVERHRDRVDEERHVVVDDVDRRCAARPSRRRASACHAHDRVPASRRAPSCQCASRGCGEVVGVGEREVVVVDAARSSARDERRRRRARRSSRRPFATARDARASRTPHASDATMRTIPSHRHDRAPPVCSARWTSPRTWTSRSSSPTWPTRSRWRGFAPTT